MVGERSKQAIPIPGRVPGERGADSLRQGAGGRRLEKLMLRSGHRPQKAHFNHS